MSVLRDTKPQGHFPKVRLIGGPSAKSTKIEIDGIEQRSVYGFELKGDVHDAMRFSLYEFVQVDVEIDLNFELSHQIRIIKIIRNPDEGKIEYELLAEVRASDVVAGLRAAADLIESKP